MNSKYANIRVIAPSSAWNPEKAKQYEVAKKRLEKLGFSISFAKNLKNISYLDVVSVADRVKDFQDAYLDESVDVVMAISGGWLANSMLPYINWELIRQNPKPFIGYSDITVLLNSIYAKTGRISYLGPNFATIASSHEASYTLESMSRILNGGRKPILLSPSNSWGVGNKRSKYKTKPWQVIKPGNAEGLLLGGNIGTLYLLQGTEYFPNFEQNTVLLVEDDDEAGEYTAREFDRRLESLFQQQGASEYIKALLIGRFQPNSGVTMAQIKSIIQAKKIEVPVIADLDFGHTQPLMTLPIGGRIIIKASSSNLRIELVEY